MSGFGELVLLLGDLHIPHRCATPSFPEKFQRMLVPNKMQHVLCTGNLGASSTGTAAYEELIRPLAPNVHVVAGDYDAVCSPNNNFPETKVLQIGQFRIGLVHGHQIVPWGEHASLAAMRRKLDVDILVYGHTHKAEVVEHDGYYHINPGSITGACSNAFSTNAVDVIPSFILLSVQGSKVVAYTYELKNDEVEVVKTEFSKNHDSILHAVR